MANETNFWSQLGAGGYGALNEVLLGLPEFLARNVAGSENYKKLQDFRARNALGSSIGGTAGFIGSMLLPGGLLTKGLSKAARLGVKGAQAARLTSLAAKLAKGAKAMDTATDVIKGTKLLGKGKFAQGAARGAASAIESAIPRALMAEDADAGSVVKDVGLSALGAGALGGAFTKGGALIKGLKKKAGEGIREAATDQILRSRGIKPKDLVKAATFGALPTEKSGRIIRSGVKQQAVDTIMKGVDGTPIKTPEDMLTYANREKGLWKKVAEGWDLDTKGKLLGEASTFANTTSPTPLTEIGRAAAQTGRIEDFMKIVNTAADAKDFGIARKYLDEFITAGSRSADPDMIFKAQIAKTVKDSLENMSIDNLITKGKVTNIDFKKMKKDYKMVKLMEDVVARNEAGMGAGITGGSDTAAKMLTSQLMGAGGLAAGGPVGALVGLAAGNLGNKAITSGVNKLATKASEGIYKSAMGKMDEAVEIVRKAATEAGVPGAEKIVEEMISKGATPEEMAAFAKTLSKGLKKGKGFDEFLAKEAAKETGAAGEIGKIIGRTGNVTDALEKDQVAAETVTPETFEEEQAKAAAQDTAQTPEDVDAGKQTQSEWIASNRNETYERLVLGNLKMVWYKTYMKKGVPFDEFVRSYYQSSNGFSPRYTASLIFSDKKKASEFMSNFDKVEQLENLDWERLGQYNPLTDKAFAGLEKWGLKDPEVTRRNTEMARATKILTLLLRNQGVTEDKVINSVLPDVERILNSRLPVEEKKARIMQMTKDFGFNMDDYLDFGMGE